jgi:hypothetical protein
MTFNAKINQTTRFVAKVETSGDRLSTTTPITLKNQVQEIRSIEDIGDVDEVNVVTGATLVYNSANDKYEVRPLDLEEFGAIDGGTF